MSTAELAYDSANEENLGLQIFEVAPDTSERPTIRLPYSTQPGPPVSGATYPAAWRLELRLENVAAKPISLLITGDTVLGRETLGSSPDIDLTPVGGWIAGVSRSHVLLRPTPNHVYVIDLQSTRGTYHNGILLSSTVASSLKNNDTLQFGELSFRIKLERAAAVH